jgi:transposase
MEWRRGRAYGQDLRDKMFAAIDRGMEPVEVAETFTVSVSWIYKALGRRRATGEMTARPQRCHVPGKLDLHHDEIRARVAAVPDMTIAELRDWLRTARGISVSHAVMWETLKRLGLSLKKRPSMLPSKNAPMSPLRARNGVSCSPG